jgi:hypothetical protein
VDWANCAQDTYNTCTDADVPGSTYAGCNVVGSGSATDKQWTEAQQANNFCNFVTFAQDSGMVAQVLVYSYMDYGESANDLSSWGIVHWNEGNGTVNGSPKQAWTSLEDAGAYQGCNVR